VLQFLQLPEINRFPFCSRRISSVWLCGLLCLLPGELLKEQASPAVNACAVGVVCKTKITIGEGYVTRTETVEAAITVMEVRRGEKAWALIKAGDSSNKFAENGMEYIAVRIRFDYGERGASGNLSYGIRDEQFASVSEGGRQYPRAAVVPPEPQLTGRLYPGESLEGWIILLVSVDDKEPLMSYGNNYNRLWLKLY
jgi:hypothetical protein